MTFLTGLIAITKSSPGMAHNMVVQALEVTRLKFHFYMTIRAGSNVVK